MGIFKEAGDTILKYSELIVHKTETYSKVAKISLDIRRRESDIRDIETEIGQLVIARAEKGDSEIPLQDTAIKELFDRIKEIKVQIETKKEELKTMKEAPATESRESS